MSKAAKKVRTLTISMEMARECFEVMREERSRAQDEISEILDGRDREDLDEDEADTLATWEARRARAQAAIAGLLAAAEAAKRTA